jgi:hypothetical protein
MSRFRDGILWGMWVLLVLVLALLLYALAEPAQAQELTGGGTAEFDTRVISTSGNTVTFPDTLRALSGSFEMVVAGGPATVSVTLNGCMRGGTCTALTSSTSTANTVLSVSGQAFDNYQITGSWTGGAGVTLTFNWTGTVAYHSIINGIPGAPVVAISGGQATSIPSSLTTNLLAGADIGSRVATCFAWFWNNGHQAGGVCDSRGEVPTTNNTNPYLTASVPTGSVWLLPCGPLTTNIPFAITDGLPSANNAQSAGQALMQGCMMDGNHGTGNAMGSTIIAGPLFTTCITSLVISQCTQQATSTLTASAWQTQNPYTQIVNVSVAAGPFAFTSVMQGCQLTIGTTPANYVYGTITSVNVGANTAQIANGLGGSAGLIGAAFVLDCAVISTAVVSQGGTPHASYSYHARNLTVDANNVGGAVGFRNWYGVEKSGWDTTKCINEINICYDLEGTQAQDSGPYTGLFASPGTACVPGTLDFVIRGGAVPREMHDWSAANGHGCPLVANIQLVSLALDSPHTRIYHGHMENKGIAIQVGGATPCPVVCPVAPAGVITGVKISGIDASCAGGGCTTIIDSGNTNNVIDSVFDVISQSVVNITDTLVDHQNVCTVTDSALAIYVLNHAGHIHDSSATQCPRPIISGATGTITGTLLAVGGCDSGTATVTGATAGMPVSVSTTDGTLQTGSFFVAASVTAANTVTVQVCAVAAGTPASKAYNVKVYATNP